MHRWPQFAGIGNFDFSLLLGLRILTTTNKLSASMPGAVPASDLKPTSDGFIFIDPTKFTESEPEDPTLEDDGILWDPNAILRA